MYVLGIVHFLCLCFAYTLVDDTCGEGEVRLVGGHSVKEGRVQMCHNQEWHSVCANNWSDSGTEAKVVCSQLGYTGDSGLYACTFIAVLANFGRDQEVEISAWGDDRHRGLRPGVRTSPGLSRFRELKCSASFGCSIVT